MPKLRIFFLAALAGCSANGLPNRYISAEKLWTQKDYRAAVVEFDQITKEDPSGSLGIQALYRASMTRTLFLSQHIEAIQGFQLVIEKAPHSELAQSAIKEIGEVYYARLDQCTKALEWYNKYKADTRFGALDRLEFDERTARCYFRMRQLAEAAKVYDEILTRGLSTKIRARILNELASVYVTASESDPSFLNKAMPIFEKVVNDFSGTEESIEAQIGIANILEQQTKLAEALAKYKSLLGRTHRDAVLKTVIARLEDRIAKKAASPKGNNKK